MEFRARQPENWNREIRRRKQPETVKTRHAIHQDSSSRLLHFAAMSSEIPDGVLKTLFWV